MSRWIWIALAIVGLLVALAQLGPASSERLPAAKDMIEHPDDWFKTEQDLGTFGQHLKDKRVALVGTGEQYALVTLTDGSKYYLRIGAFPGIFAQVMADQLGSGAQVVAIGNIQPPTNLLARVLRQFNGMVIIQLLSLVVIGVMVLQMTNVLDFGGWYEFEKAPTARFTDVIGCPEAKSALTDICAYLAHPERFKALGARPPKGVLMVGPPGTGKTLLARALAGECGVPVIVLNGSSFSDKFMGVGVQRAKRLFKIARSHGRCVIFIDEIDGVGRRGGDGGAADTENSRVINSLLVSMDGYTENQGVIVIGATNHLDAVDPALRREGRFDRSCTLTLPSIDERAALFQHYANQLVLEDKGTEARAGFYRQLARLAVGLSPAAIAGAVNDAAVLAVKAGESAVRMEHFRQALEQKRLGSPTDGIAKAMLPEERERVAVHEAGHAIIALLRKVGEVEKVTIVPRAEALGVTLVTHNDERFLQTESELRNRMDMLLGGRVAERLVMHEASTGAADDLKRASEIALRMASEFGFSQDGPFSYAALPAHEQAHTPEHIQKLAAQWVSEAESRADALLREYLPVVRQVAALLMEHETIDGSAVAHCVRDYAAARPASRAA